MKEPWQTHGAFFKNAENRRYDFFLPFSAGAVFFPPHDFFVRFYATKESIGIQAKSGMRILK